MTRVRAQQSATAATALLTVVLLVVGGLTAARLLRAESADGPRRLDVLARQRMLSRRVPLLVSEVAQDRADGPGDARLLERAHQAVVVLRSSQAAVSQGGPEVSLVAAPTGSRVTAITHGEVRRLLDGPEGLDATVADFCDQADQLLDALSSAEGGTAILTPRLTSLTSRSQAVLDQIQAAVAAERSAQEDDAAALRLRDLVLVVVLVLLIISCAATFSVARSGRRRQAARHRSEQADERHLRQVMEHLAEAVLLVSGQGEVAYLSPRAASLWGPTGPPRPTVDGATVGLLDLVVADDQHALGEVFAVALRAGTPLAQPPLELRLAGAADTWVQVSVEDLRADPVLGAVVVRLTDVRAARRVQLELDASRDRYRLLVESSPDAVLLAEDEVFTYANAEASRLFGVADAQELVGRSTSLLVRAALSPAHGEQMRAALVGSTAARGLAATLRGKGGASVRVEAAVAPPPSGTGERVIVLRDTTAWHRTITDLGAAEERLRTSLDAVLSSFARYRAVRSPLGAVVDFELQWVNAAGAKSYPVPTAQMIGSRLRPLTQPDLFERYLDVMRTGEPLHDVCELRGAGPTHIELQAARLGEELVLSYVDVSERIGEQRRVTEAEARFRTAFMQAPVGMAVVRPDGVIEDVNLALVTFTGRAAEQLRGGFITEGMDLEDRRDALAAMLSLCAGEVPTAEAEYRYLRPDGRHSIGRFVTSPVRSEHRVEALLLQVVDVTEEHAARAQLARSATYDVLTGLPNRRLLGDHLDALLDTAVRAGRDVSVLFLDLDQFKPVNDQYGHQAGDVVLQAVAARISGLLGDGEMVARLGGDEFVVVGDGLDALGAAGLTARIEAAVAQPIRLTGRSEGPAVVCVEVSSGTVTVPGGELPRPSARDVLSRADQLMYVRKKTSRQPLPSRSTRVGAVPGPRPAQPADRAQAV